METITLHRGPVGITPKEAGYDPAVLDRLNDHYRSLIEQGTIQGASYMMARNGNTFAHGSLGKLTFREDSLVLLPGSIRKTYSMTKVITTTAIMQLVERGQLYLDQSVSTIVKEFDTNMHREITIAHLITHTSGLRGDPGYDMVPHALPYFETTNRVMKKRDPSYGWIKIVLSGPLVAAPGREWHYCTAGYAILGEIVARVSGMPYHEYAQQEILTPLGMSRSFFLVPPELRDEVCVMDESEENDLSAGRLPEDDPSTAGEGLYTTLEDLMRIGQAMLNGGTLNGTRILSKRAVEMMVGNRLSGVSMQGWGADESDYRFGLGWSLDDFDLCTPGTFGHEGYGHCGMLVDPAERLVFVFFVPSRRGFTSESVVTPKSIVWSGLE